MDFFFSERIFFLFVNEMFIYKGDRRRTKTSNFKAFLYIPSSACEEFSFSASFFYFLSLEVRLAREKVDIEKQCVRKGKQWSWLSIE